MAYLVAHEGTNTQNDMENVLFCSIHFYSMDFYPLSGAGGPHGDSPELQNEPNVINIVRSPSLRHVIV